MIWTTPTQSPISQLHWHPRNSIWIPRVCGISDVSNLVALLQVGICRVIIHPDSPSVFIQELDSACQVTYYIYLSNFVVCSRLCLAISIINLSLRPMTRAIQSTSWQEKYLNEVIWSHCLRWGDWLQWHSIIEVTHVKRSELYLLA